MFQYQRSKSMNVANVSITDRVIYLWVIGEQGKGGLAVVDTGFIYLGFQDTVNAQIKTSPVWYYQDSTGHSFKGHLIIDDGLQAGGKILTSDAAGKGSWEYFKYPYADSATIFSLTPNQFTSFGCTDCTGNGVTGAVLTYFGGMWRRQKFE